MNCGDWEISEETSEIKEGRVAIDKNAMILFDFGITRYSFFFLNLKKITTCVNLLY